MAQYKLVNQTTEQVKVSVFDFSVKYNKKTKKTELVKDKTVAITGFTPVTDPNHIKICIAVQADSGDTQGLCLELAEVQEEKSEA